jgi:hypothetical protein
LAFGVEIDKDVVRRVLSVHYRPESDSGGRMVKVFMRRDCNTEVSRRGALDSGCQVADWAQAEQRQGRAQRCSCLGGFFPDRKFMIPASTCSAGPRAATSRGYW